MAPMKRAASAGVASRCASVKKALEGCEYPARVKLMLSRTLSDTVGTPAADRHPFNERFVAMIEQVLQAEHARLNQEVTSKDAAFQEHEQAKHQKLAELADKNVATQEKNAALDEARKAVSDVAALVKAKEADSVAVRKAQKSGDAEAAAIAAKKEALEATQNGALVALVNGSCAAEEKAKLVAEVLKAGGDFSFDASLMNTAAQVLEREASERGGFDTTCLEQLKEAFSGAVAKFGEEYAAHGPGMAERAAAVEQADAAKAAAEESRTNLKEKFAAAKEAKSAADAEQKEATVALNALISSQAIVKMMEGAKKAVKAFEEGAQVAFNELKEFKEGDFVKKPNFLQVDGMKLERAVIDSCREGVAPEGATPGRVTAADAQKVFTNIAHSRTQRWTLCYCLTEFDWEEAAHDWIVEELKAHAPAESPAKKAKTVKGYYETVDGCKCDRRIIDVCRNTDGRINIEAAQQVWAQTADGGKVTSAEKWTLRHCLSAFNWSREAHDFVLAELRKVDSKGAASA